MVCKHGFESFGTLNGCRILGGSSVNELTSYCPGGCGGKFRTYRPTMTPYPCLWMLVIKCHSYYGRCKTQNCWCSVDTYFQDGVESISLFLFAIMAANTAFMIEFNLSIPQITQVTRPTVVDANSQDIVGRICLCVLIIKVANTSKMNCAVPMLLLYN